MNTGKEESMEKKSIKMCTQCGATMYPKSHKCFACGYEEKQVQEAPCGESQMQAQKVLTCNGPMKICICIQEDSST